MRRRIVGWFVLIPLCVVLVIFALANRHQVVVRINPLEAADPGAPGAGMPLFLLLYAVLFLGIALGGIAVWWTQGRYRRDERRYRKRAEQLQAQLDAQRSRKSRENDAALAATDELA